MKLLLPDFATVEEVPDFISFNPKRGGKGQGKAGAQPAGGAPPAKRQHVDSGGGGSSRRQLQESEEGEQEGWEEEEEDDDSDGARSSAGAGPPEDPSDRCAPFLQVRPPPARRWPA